VAVVESTPTLGSIATFKVPKKVPAKKSVVFLGTYEPKHKLLHSLYVALTKLSELGLVENPGLFENNVVLGSQGELDYARITFRVGRRRREKWLVGVHSELSSRMLADLNAAIRSLRGELSEDIKDMLDEYEELEKIMETTKNVAYVYDASTQLYASLELSNLVAAIEGRKVDRLAVVSVGKGGIPSFVRGTLEAMRELGYLKAYMIVEVNNLNSFEMLKLAKFLFL